MTFGRAAGGTGAISTSLEILIPVTGIISYIDISGQLTGIWNAAASSEALYINVVRSGAPTGGADELASSGNLLATGSAGIRLESSTNANGVGINKFCPMYLPVRNGEKLWMLYQASNNSSWQVQVVIGVLVG